MNLVEAVIVLLLVIVKGLSFDFSGVNKHNDWNY